MVEIEQLRAARALLGWSQTELAEKAGVSLPTVKRAERAEGGPAVSDDVITKLQLALERAGVEFIAENGGGAGARMRKPRRKR
ncbi:helix-turn-helix transcriptional regulator [soil metagenome]